jgi:hypothetical protein
MENNLLNDDDLADILSQLGAEEVKEEKNEDIEMEASQRRYMEIIKKHKND